jgi:hypothetical protein
MNTTTNIHDVTNIEVRHSRKLDTGTWVREVAFSTATGSITITCFADDLKDVAFQFETLDDR